MVVRARGRWLSILFSAMLLGRAFAVRGHTEVRVELQMERWAARGGSVRLRCVHDVPPHLLDKVVFLRQGTKIFQYIRDRKPPYRNFTTPGAVLNIALATENSIILQNLDFAASGEYSCEVSLDTPIYTKASSAKELTVFHSFTSDDEPSLQAVLNNRLSTETQNFNVLHINAQSIPAHFTDMLASLNHDNVHAIDPQKHHPRIDYPTRYLDFGETLRVNCTTAPAFPAPHITWFINGRKMDELVAHSHKYRILSSDRSGRRGLQRAYEKDPLSTSPSLVALTHASHVATRPPGCNVKETQIGEINKLIEPNVVYPTSRHKSHRPFRKELYITISELQLVATGRLEITCVSTIPEFRSIEDKFADVRNDTIIVDVIQPAVIFQPYENLTKADISTSSGSRSTIAYNLCLISFYLIKLA